MKIGISGYKAINKLKEFEIAPITVLVGPNGAGKSSVINMLRASSRIIGANHFSEGGFDRTNLLADNYQYEPGNLFKREVRRYSPSLSLFNPIRNSFKYKSTDFNNNVDDNRITLKYPLKLSDFPDSHSMILKYVHNSSDYAILDKFEIINDETGKTLIFIESFTSDNNTRNIRLRINIKYLEDFYLNIWGPDNFIDKIENQDEDSPTKFGVGPLSTSDIEDFNSEMELGNKAINKRLVDLYERSIYDKENFEFTPTESVSDIISIRNLEDILPVCNPRAGFINFRSELDEQLNLDFIDKKMRFDFIDDKIKIINKKFRKDLLSKDGICIANFDLTVFSSILSLEGLKDLIDRWIIESFESEEAFKPFFQRQLGFRAKFFEVSQFAEVLLGDLLFLNITEAMSVVGKGLEQHIHISPSRNYINDFNNVVASEIDSRYGLLDIVNAPIQPTLNFINFWCKQFDLGSEFAFKDIQEFLNVLRNPDALQEDVGFGIKQLLPLIGVSSILPNPGLYEQRFLESFRNQRAPRDYVFEVLYPVGNFIFIEEPEANLHPNFQSKLSDMFIESCLKFNNRFVLETHSEYIVRKLQYWVAIGKIEPEIIQIYYFENSDNDEIKIKPINVMSDGSLSGSFGSGFFDESDKISLDIFRFNNSLN